MKYLLDTHTLLWWVHGDAQLSERARNTITQARERQQVLVSAISAWEIALLVEKKRLTLNLPTAAWLKIASQISGVEWVPIDWEMAFQSTQLGESFHKDPADRLIVATAQRMGATLISLDSKISAYPHIQTLW